MKTTILMTMLLILAANAALADWRHETNKPREGSRDYQQQSVGRVQQEANSMVDEVKAFLARIHVTPARLALGLGLLGIFWTLNRNKRHIHWAMITALSWCLLAFGVAAMFFDWPAFN
ncbi:MAG: hypothetical protein JRH20_11740 [Deltaproteobacteria bacterium]|nr:hypothetical protein [Deltaproteobacteria bacterium]